MHDVELPERLGITCSNIAKKNSNDADGDRRHDAEAIRQPPHQHAANAEAHHGAGEGERRGPARGMKLELDDGNDHDNRPHADAAERADNQGDAQPHPRRVRVGPEGRMRGLIDGNRHGRNLSGLDSGVKRFSECGPCGNDVLRAGGSGAELRPLTLS